MALTSDVLRAAGCGWWDMGQEHTYKIAMGAALTPRADFLREFHRAPRSVAEISRREISRRVRGRHTLHHYICPQPPTPVPARTELRSRDCCLYDIGEGGANADALLADASPPRAYAGAAD